MKNLDCEYCLGVQGICTECQACFYDHCECDPCAHNKMRNEDCVFCMRGITGQGVVDAVNENLIEEVIHAAAKQLGARLGTDLRQRDNRAYESDDLEKYHLTTDGVVAGPGCWIHPYSFRDMFGEEEYQKLLARPRVASPYPEEYGGEA